MNYHHDHINKFLSTAFTTPNKLLLSVAELLQIKFNIACIRALGIAGKIVTSPFWHIIEHCDNILSMNPYLDMLKHKLVSLSEKAKPVFHDETIWDESDDLVKVNRDKIYDKLFMDTNNDELETLTVQALEQFFFINVDHFGKASW